MNRNWLTLFALLLAALCGPLASPVAAQQTTPINSYTAVDLGHLGGGGTTAYGLNDAGQVVGESVALVNGVYASRAFRWAGGVMSDLGTLGGSQSRANAINNGGQVVGWADTAAGATRAFLWDASGGMQNLGTLGGAASWASGINDAGQVVGAAYNGAGVLRAFLWQNGQMTDLGTLPGYVGSAATGVNASGQVVGHATDTYGNRRAFRWTPAVPNGTTGTMVALHDGLFTNIANAINGFGEAVGQVGDAPYLWDSAGAQALPLLDDSSISWYTGWYVYGGSGAAINDSRHVAGSALWVFRGSENYGTAYSSYAMIWDSVNGMRALGLVEGNRLHGTLVDADITFGQARGINASSQIVADGYLLNPSPLPTRPAYLSATAWDARVDLSWSASPSATSYTVKRSTSGTAAGPFEAVATGVTSTTWTDTAVTNGTAYYYVVSASNEWGESLNSSVAWARPMPPPGAPTGLKATAGDQQVSLTWNASAGADSYKVYRSTTPGGPYEYIDYSIAAGYEDWVVNGTTYYYVVTAANSSGESGYSNQASATPMPPPPPPAPTALTATAGDTRVSLSWNASEGATSYNLKRATSSGGPYTLVSRISGTSYTDTGLTNGTTYYYVVSAANSGGESPDSTQVSATPTGPPPPAAPTGLTATAGKRKVSLTWAQSATTGVTQNRVYRSTTSGGPYSLRANLGAGTSYADTSVTSGVTYHYRVTALKSGQESPYSNQASARPR